MAIRCCTPNAVSGMIISSFEIGQRGTYAMNLNYSGGLWLMTKASELLVRLKLLKVKLYCFSGGKRTLVQDAA